MNDQILLIDGDAEFRELVATMLGAHAYTVVLAASVPQALERLYERDFDAIVTDVYMTSGRGLEPCTTLSATFPGLPIIVCTGQGSMELAISAIRAGAYDFITKPIVVQSLIDAVRRAISYHRRRRK